MAESEEELKNVLMKVKEESEKDGLKLNVKKTKIMASDPISSVHSLSHVRLIVTPRTCQAPLAMKFFRREYWSGWPFPSPGDPPDAGIEPGSRADSSSSEPLGKPLHQKQDLYSPLVHPCRLLTHKYHLQC